MTRSFDRASDRAIRQYQKDHPGMSLSDARRAVQRAAEQEQSPMPRRLPVVPVPIPGQSLESCEWKLIAFTVGGEPQQERGGQDTEPSMLSILTDRPALALTEHCRRRPVGPPFELQPHDVFYREAAPPAGVLPVVPGNPAQERTRG